MPIPEAVRKELADALYWAEKRREPIEPLTERYPELTVADAYAIQAEVIARKVREGARVVGKKIGLTSPAMQQMLGVDQPDYGYLLDWMEVADGGRIELGHLIQPRIEGEIAFVLRRDLVGPEVEVEEVLEATEYVVPALEVIDSRIRDWRIRLADTIADNASSGVFVLGKQRWGVSGLDLATVQMVLRCNGKDVLQGVGSAVLGHPARAVAWLARALSAFGERLRAGEVILSGSLGAARPVTSGDLIEADFQQLGTVSVRFA